MTSNGPLIFISHSSKDIEIIKPFIDHILKNGIGFRNEEIACTSFVATGISPGASIPDYIKRNILGSKICLAMISKNYKSSEVCMNEVGAAWAVGNVPVQIVLPDANFDELGWLISTNKAAKINDEASLDSLMEIICNRCGKSIVTPKDWNPCKKEFLQSMEKAQSSQKDEIKVKESKKIVRFPESVFTLAKKPSLNVFDTHFRVRDIDEGEYQTQIDFRLRADENVSIRHMWLINNDSFSGSLFKESNEIELVGYIPYKLCDIDSMTNEEFKLFSKERNKSSTKVLDLHINKDEQISMSFVGTIVTIREMDGYMDLPENKWSIKIEYNISDEVIVPVEMIKANGARVGYYYHN